MSANVERIAAEQSPVVARELQRIARLGGTEADFRREFLEEAGKYAPARRGESESSILGIRPGHRRTRPFVGRGPDLR